MSIVRDYWEENYEEIEQAYINEIKEIIERYEELGDSEDLKDIREYTPEWVAEYIQFKLDMLRDEEDDRRLEDLRERSLDE